MGNIFNFNNWSKLQYSENNNISFLDQKRNVLFTKFCILASVSAVIQGIYDLVDGFPFVMLLDFSIAGILIIGLFLNENRKHLLAKMLVLIVSNIMLFSFAAIVPQGVGIYLLFYPLVAFSFLTLGFNYRIYSYGLTALAILLNAILVFSNFQPFGEINIQPTDPSISFTINLLISIVLLGLGVGFTMEINNDAEKKILENQLHAEMLVSVISESNESLKKTNNELDRFVYSTSHDLRSPLASILGLINLMEMEKDTISPNIFHYINLMKNRVQNLDNFIQDIIDYSRNNKADLVLTQVNVAKVIDEVILNNMFLENAKKTKISPHVTIEKPLQLDQNRLMRILSNLVSNAIKYNNMSNVQPTVDIFANIDGKNLILQVRDNGFGIGDEIKDKVFDMFYRGTDKEGGSGLGLYITKEMVEKMNGTILLETEIDKHTTFTVSIPLDLKDL